MTPTQQFILDLVKLLIPLFVGIHMPQPRYMKKKEEPPK